MNQHVISDGRTLVVGTRTLMWLGLPDAYSEQARAWQHTAVPSYQSPRCSKAAKELAANSDDVPSEPGSEYTSASHRPDDTPEMPGEQRETGLCKPKLRTTCTSRPHENPYSHVPARALRDPKDPHSHVLSATQLKALQGSTFGHPHSPSFWQSLNPDPHMVFMDTLFRVIPVTRGPRHQDQRRDDKQAR